MNTPNPANPPTRRPSLSEVVLRVDGLEQSYGSIEAAMADINNRMARLTALGATLTQKARGIKPANQKVNRLAADFQALIDRIGNFDFASDVPGPIRDGMVQEMERIATRGDELYADMQCQIDAIKARTEEAHDRIDQHDLKFVNHDDRITANATAVARAHTRIDQMRHTIPGWGWLVAAGAGVAAYIVWMAKDFTSRTIDAANNVISTTTSVADEPFAGVIAGLAAFCAVSAIIFVATGYIESQASATAASGASANVSNGSNAAQDPDNTQVLPAPPQPPSTGSQPVASGSNPNPTQASGNVTASAGAGAAATS